MTDMPISPHSRTVDLSPAAIGIFPTREHIAAAVETLIALLDALEPDTDVEECDDDMCGAADDAGTGHHWLHPGDGLPGDADDGEPETDFGAEEAGEPEEYHACPTFGMDQTGPWVGPITEFCEINGLAKEQLAEHHPPREYPRRPVLRPRYR